MKELSRRECQMEGEQSGFRRGRGFVYQVFGLKEMCEKYPGNGKELYVASVNLEKA